MAALGAAYVIGGSCSDDGFADFRGWLISRGKSVYDAALLNPDTLASSLDNVVENCQVEGFQYLAAQVWESLTREPAENLPGRSSPFPDAPSGQRLEEGNLQVLSLQFPRLWSKFGAIHKHSTTPAENPAPGRSESKHVEGLGEIKVGDAFIHTKFGRGVIEQLETEGEMLLIKMRFGDVARFLTFLKGSSFLSRE